MPSKELQGSLCCEQQFQELIVMLDKANKTVSSLTGLGVGLLALAIVVSLLVGPGQVAFFGAVVGNITSLITTLGAAGLPGLIALGVIVWLFQK